jgi:hypothetical protein
MEKLSTICDPCPTKFWSAFSIARDLKIFLSSVDVITAMPSVVIKLAACDVLDSTRHETSKRQLEKYLNLLKNITFTFYNNPLR